MANTDQIFGLKPIKFNPNLVIPCAKAAGTTVTNDMFVGDPVAFDGTAGANGNTGVTVSTAGDGNPILGVVVSIAPQPDHLDRPTWIDGADAGTVMVCIDPNAIYEAQADEAVAVTDVGMNANLVLTQSGSRTAGTSGFEVDGTVATTNTYQLKVIGFPNRADNEINTTNNKVLVVVLDKQLVTETATTGV